MMPVGLVSAFILPKDFEYVCVPSLHVLRRLDLTGPGSCKKGLASFGRLVFYQNEFFISEAIQLTVMFPRATSLCTKEKSLKCGSKIGSERESRRCGSAAIASRTAFITSAISTLLDVVLKESSLVNIFQRHLASV
jgi:hypothetical protein